MAKVSVAKELDTIKNSIDDLSSKITEYVSPTGEHDNHGLSGWGKDDESTTGFSDYKEYTNLVVERNIAEVELRLTDKIGTMKTDLGQKIESIKPEKPNYVLIFLSVFIATVITIVAIFIGIIPIYCDNIWNNNSSKIEKTINTNVDNYIDGKISEIKKTLKIK